jgi:phenylalanyl-tRNA synthetase beta chain
MPAPELARRLMLAGFNHEGTSEVGGDLAVDLEITSNRPDCLGHLGIAREVAVLWGRQVKLPSASPAEAAEPVARLTSVELRCPELCRRYTARVIQGVTIGPSPSWLVRRLATLGVAAINNVVDVTNYVLFECGQPLHAFDLAGLRGRRIVVRDALPGERFLAINHKTYDLPSGTCVIADAEAAVGLGGVMGGAESEVTQDTKDILVESAEFAPMAIRNAARSLGLHSDSSYRFERGIDPEGVDWASRRACELILEIAGGSLARGSIDVGQQPAPRAPVVLRFAQLKRVLGIEIAPAEVRRILSALGNVERREDAGEVEVVPPAWRRDLSREIDLVEEVARIHGYDAIPEDVRVPMAASARTDEDRVLAKVRHAMTAAGFDEAMTLSLVDEEWSAAFSPWTEAPPLVSQMPILRGADRLRRSLVPSLLGARRTNETLANPAIELFEIARAYLPKEDGLPDEQPMLALSSGRDYGQVKGTVETMLRELDSTARLEVRRAGHDLLDPDRSGELVLGGEVVGYLGEVSAEGRQRFDLRGPTTVAELRLRPLAAAARLVPQYAPVSPFPPIVRDLNFVVDESVRWSELEGSVRESAGPLLESLDYRETYRSDQLGAGKKSLLMSIILRGQGGTLTSDEADRIRDEIVAHCGRTLGARLRA